MSNGVKIIITILILIAIGLGMYGIKINIDAKKGENNTASNSEIMNYFNDTEVNNEYVNNETENTTNENQNNATENNTSAIKTDNVVGKEEQESSQNNTSAKDEQTAIELAKKEWGIAVDSYTYEPTLQSDGTYVVSVRNKATTYEEARYIVDLKTGAVTEAK